MSLLSLTRLCPPIPAHKANKRDTLAQRKKGTCTNINNIPTMISYSTFMPQCVKGTFHTLRRPLKSIYNIAIEMSDTQLARRVCVCPVEMT